MGAYGLPTDELTTAWDRYFWPLRAPDRDIARNIEKAWHALALNDERYTFKPVLWNEKNEPQDRTSIFEENITQVWFAGMHADVGGGYPDDAMAYIPLRWIIKGAKHYGLRFCPTQEKLIDADCDTEGPMHNSRSSRALFYRYGPRKLEQLCDDVDPYRSGNIVRIERPKIHHSVMQRIKSGTQSFAPFGLPDAYAVVDDSGQIHDLPQTHGGGSPHLETRTTAVARDREQARTVWPFTWVRLYFAYYPSVLLAAIILLLPFVLGDEFDGACGESRWCWLSFIPRYLSYVLPAFAGAWPEVLSVESGLDGRLERGRGRTVVVERLS